jgi:hypothetical protein
MHPFGDLLNGNGRGRKEGREGWRDAGRKEGRSLFLLGSTLSILSFLSQLLKQLKLRK